MYKVKIRIILLILVTVLIAAVISVFGSTYAVKAESIDQSAEEQSAENIQPMFLTLISLNFSVNNGSVTAKANNDFTLGFSTIQVYVYLYSNLTYSDNYNYMTLESSNYTSDLNIYQNITASAAINGVGRYWQGRCRYKLNNNNWEELNTATYYVDAWGTISAA